MNADDPAAPPASLPVAARDRRIDAAIGVVVAVLVLGPALGPGTLFNLDLIVTPEIPVPPGVWGLGPGLSQRVPLYLPIAWIAAVVGGPVAVKLFLVATLAVGHVGMARLVAPVTGLLGRTAAGVLWVAGPFLVTRVAVGHLQFAWLAAVLPWVLARLLRPSDDVGRTFVAVALVAFGGPAAGAIALGLVAVGLVVEGRSRRLVPVIAASAAGNLPWVGPTAVLLWAGAQVNGASGFPTRPRGVDGWIGLSVGGGFWSPLQQVGATGWVAAVAAVVLVALAVVGTRRLPWWGTGVAIAGGVGLLITVASAVPGVRDLYDGITRLPSGAALRERQRFAVLWLLWLAPASAAGGEVVARRLAARAGAAAAGGADLARALPLAVVVAVSIGGWWGAGGVLEPTKLPAGWSAARDLVRERPGTTVALPWAEYLGWTFTDGRHTLNPLPDVLGGDVISSFDPKLDPSTPSQEQVDRRAWFLDEHLRGDGPLGPAFQQVGVRWVVFARQPSTGPYEARLRAEADVFRVVLADDDVAVYEVAGWVPGAVDPTGAGHPMSRPIRPLIRTDAPDRSVLPVAAAPGWVQGWFRPLSSTPDGRLQLPDGGSGPVWFWPAAALMVVDAAVVAGVLGSLRRRARSSDPAASAT